MLGLEGQCAGLEGGETWIDVGDRCSECAGCSPGGVVVRTFEEEARHQERRYAKDREPRVVGAEAAISGPDPTIIGEKLPATIA